MILLLGSWGTSAPAAGTPRRVLELATDGFCTRWNRGIPERVYPNWGTPQRRGQIEAKPPGASTFIASPPLCKSMAVSFQSEFVCSSVSGKEQVRIDLIRTLPGVSPPPLRYPRVANTPYSSSMATRDPSGNPILSAIVGHFTAMRYAVGGSPPYSVRAS
jgi:hypothetical protein